MRTAWIIIIYGANNAYKLLAAPHVQLLVAKGINSYSYCFTYKELSFVKLNVYEYEYCTLLDCCSNLFSAIVLV